MNIINQCESCARQNECDFMSCAGFVEDEEACAERRHYEDLMAEWQEEEEAMREPAQ